VRNAFTLAKLLVRDLGAQGYGEYRAHLEFMDLASDQYSFNDHAYRRFVEKIKDAVDPNGVLSPGRHGIWPAAYRTR
jgi:4-cresol dehydrogenase (hydroxylating)